MPKLLKQWMKTFREVLFPVTFHFEINLKIKLQCGALVYALVDKEETRVWKRERERDRGGWMGEYEK